MSTPALAENSADLELLLSTSRCIQCDLSSIDFSGKDLSSTNLSSADLSRANLSGANFSNANLSKADLNHANLQSTQLEKVNLKNSNLSDADLSQANLNSADFTDAYLVNANFNGANLTSARFTGFFGGAANLKSVNFSGADLHAAILRDTNLVNANLSRANLSKGTDLRGAKLDSSDLNNADLSGANLRDASLIYVNLQNANLNSADLSRVNLTGSDLSEVDFTNIKLTDAILDKAIGLDTYAEQLLQQARIQAASENFLTAISSLKAIPVQTKAYPEAQIKIAQYAELQEEAEAKQLLQNAESAARNSKYKEALNYLKKIPEETKAYTEAQEKIVNYQNRLQEEVEAEKLLQNAYGFAENSEYQEAISNLEKIPKDTKAYMKAQEKIAEYTEKQKLNLNHSEDFIFFATLSQSASQEAKAWGEELPNSAKIELAKSACTTFSKGVSFNQVALATIALIGNDQTALKYVSNIIGAGVAAYCPEYSSKLYLSS